jgi:hypothetical protein
MNRIMKHVGTIFRQRLATNNSIADILQFRSFSLLRFFKIERWYFVERFYIQSKKVSEKRDLV